MRRQSASGWRRTIRRGRSASRLPARAAAGLHRRSRRRRSRRDARRDARPRRRPRSRSTRWSRPSSSSTTRSRSTSTRARSRSTATPRWSSSATASATPSCAGARAPSRTSPSSRRHGHRPPGQPRVPGPRRRVARRPLQAFPDTLVGTDSHTTMINGLGVLGWGVGGIEAEAAMLGEAISMLVPQVVGFQLDGPAAGGRDRDRPRPDRHADPPQAGVVGKFVEYFGEGLQALPLADRATIGNMSPEYGATCGFFPVDERHDRVPAPDRPPRGARRARRGLLQGEPALARPPTASPPTPRSSSSTSSTVEPSLAGPAAPAGPRPADDAKRLPRGARHLRRRLRELPRRSRRRHLPGQRPRRRAGTGPRVARCARAGRDARGGLGRGTGARRRRGGARRRDVRARARRRRDRRDHELHEHVEPVR